VDLFDVFDVEAGERVEAELDRFIEKRARDRSKENALEEAERQLSPKEASAQDLLAAASATPEQLKNALDAALRLGDAGEDSALLFFQVARQKDFDDLVAWATDLREDWAELYVDILEGTNQPDVDPGDRFELLASKSPDRYDLINRAAQPDINRYGQMR